MRRRHILAAAVAELAAVPFAEAADFEEHLVEFHAHYNKFVRTYLGCPKKAVDVEQCNRSQGSIDYVEFHKARQAAIKLFQLGG